MPSNLAKMSPKALGDTKDPNAIPLLSKYLQDGSIPEKTHAASAIRKIATTHRHDCKFVIPDLMKCAMMGKGKSLAQLRQYSLLALERIELTETLINWLTNITENEEVEYVKEVAQRILARIKRDTLIKNGCDALSSIKQSFNHYGIKSLWHITHIDNAWSICRYGVLNHRDAHEKRPTLQDISDPLVQRWRSRSDPIFNRSIHDYAALYINPKNPMLFKRRAIKDQLCLVEISLAILAAQPYLLSDGNAASITTKFYRDLDGLKNLPWETLHNIKGWANQSDGKRKMCAEALIYPRVWPCYIKAVHTPRTGCCFEHLIEKPVKHTPELFF
jgi:hypothetical protein